jgi:hypothetical protein
MNTPIQPSVYFMHIKKEQNLKLQLKTNKSTFTETFDKDADAGVLYVLDIH